MQVINFTPYVPDLNPIPQPEKPWSKGYYPGTNKPYEPEYLRAAEKALADWKVEQGVRNKLTNLVSLGAPMLTSEDGANWFSFVEKLPAGGRYALVQDGVVISVTTDATALSPPNTDIILLVDVSEDTSIGWTWDGEQVFCAEWNQS